MGRLGALLAAAARDPLTDLPTRARLDRALRRGAGASPVALLSVDLDRFKQVNDAAGHRAGDVVLRATARRLRAAVPPGDHVVRVGGDEFAVLARSVATTAAAEALARRVVAAVGAPVVLPEDGEVTVTASVGVALCDSSSPTLPPRERARVLQEQADLALYAAKVRGGDGAVVYRPHLRADARAAAALGTRVQQAVLQQAFELRYQPVVDLDGRPRRVEGLLRFVAPDGRLLPPAPLLREADRAGYLDRITAWVLDEAAAASWGAPVPLSVNVEASQLSGPGGKALVGRLVSAAEGGRPLVVEVHRGTGLLDEVGLRRARDRLAEARLPVVLDDAAGEWSLLDVLGIGPDEVTLDRAAVVVDDPTARTALRAFVGALVSAGIPVTAKGVASPATAALVHELGCVAVQGEWPAGPVPGPELAGALRDAADRVSAWWTSHLSMRDALDADLTPDQHGWDSAVVRSTILVRPPRVR